MEIQHNNPILYVQHSHEFWTQKLRHFGPNIFGNWYVLQPNCL